ncbi:MAG: hypothetical protein H6707_07015 [Deltaproteobacteria bacterium]|nr:hypothetical protein [Deltaproteobacteria bacterium]
MSDESAGGRRPRRRGSGGGGGGGGGGGRPDHSAGNNGLKKRRRRRRGRGPVGNGRSTIDRLPPSTRDDSSVLGGRETMAERRQVYDGPPDKFQLFCSYYLGITPEDGYQKPNVKEIARWHGMDVEQIESLLEEFDLKPATVKATSFDLVGAQLDIRVAPEGLSRTEIARDLYEQYIEALDS